MIVQEDNVPTSYNVDSIDVQLARHKDKLTDSILRLSLAIQDTLDQTIYLDPTRSYPGQHG